MPEAPTCSVLHLLSQILKTQGFYTIRYNSRGVGGSSGWRSLTGLQEGLDLQEVVQWALSYIADVRHVLLVVSTQLLLMTPKMNLRLIGNPVGLFSWISHRRPASSTSQSHSNITHSSLLPARQESLPHVLPLKRTRRSAKVALTIRSFKCPDRLRGSR